MLTTILCVIILACILYFVFWIMIGRDRTEKEEDDEVTWYKVNYQELSSFQKIGVLLKKLEEQQDLKRDDEDVQRMRDIFSEIYEWQINIELMLKDELMFYTNVIVWLEEADEYRKTHIRPVQPNTFKPPTDLDQDRLTRLLATLPDGLSQKPTHLCRGSRTRSVGTDASQSSLSSPAIDTGLHRATWLMTAYMNRGWLRAESLWCAATGNDPVGRLSAAARYVRGAIVVRVEVEPPDLDRTTFTVDFGALRQRLLPKAVATEPPVKKGLCCTPIRYEPPAATTESGETSEKEEKKK